jgi:hypothetical protein
MTPILKWILIIEDFQMDRPGQTTTEDVLITAPTAEDAITIARVRHRVPLIEDASGEFAHRMHTRRLRNIRPALEGEVPSYFEQLR